MKHFLRFVFPGIDPVRNPLPDAKQAYASKKRKASTNVEEETHIKDLKQLHVDEITMKKVNSDLQRNEKKRMKDNKLKQKQEEIERKQLIREEKKQKKSLKTSNKK